MYLDHFGLDRQPFKITPDTSLFFEGSRRGASLDALVYAIEHGEGIIKVVGEVGSGKTMLCRMAEIRLAENVDVVYIANPSLSPDNILHVISHELKLSVDTSTSKIDVMQKLQTYLLEKHAKNLQVVLFVEEAQSMPVDTLEEIRLLSNLETDENKLLQMVLFGQPELDDKLALPQIRQLKERITHSFYLDPFPPKDTQDYLNFRLRSVGYRGPNIFNEKTAKVVKKYSGGLTRRINILADKSLLAAFSKGSHAVTAKHVCFAAEDSDFRKPFAIQPWMYAVSGITLFVVAIWIGTMIPQNPTETVVAINNSKEEIIYQNTETRPILVNTTDVVASVSENVLAKEQSNKTVEDGLNTRLVPSLLDARLSETATWIQSASDGHYSIQLFMTRIRDARGVEKFLANVPEILDFEKIYIYETIINGSRMYSVLYNDYVSRETASLKLKSLPADLQASKPYLRRVSSLRKDLLRIS